MQCQVTAEPVQSFDALGTTWCALEREVLPGVFRSWTWVGCLAQERYSDPVLLRAERDGRLVGLALYNRRGRRLHLAESGEAERDRPFVEHNGPLALDPEAEAALLRTAWDLGGVDRLVLGGVAPELPAAAGGVPLMWQERSAPWLDLDALRAAGGDYLASLGAGTRQQIRRSGRFYAAGGALHLARCDDPATLDAWFPDLVALHGATWARRGQVGAFATPFLERFHRTFMERALARGQLDLLRVLGGWGVVGFLYNLRANGCVHAYQSALADPTGQPHAKPGLTCHALAVADALARGDHTYDFLAGDQRYKRSLANREATLVWAELARPGSPAALAARLRDTARSWLGSARQMLAAAWRS